MSWIIRFLGFLTTVAVLGAFLNPVLKGIGREYLKSVPAEYASYTDAYRGFMRFMVRRHRYFGMAALALLPVHAASAVLLAGLSVTGLVTAVLLSLTAALGIYGFFINKNLRAGWVGFHRGSAFLTVISWVVHVAWKG